MKPLTENATRAIVSIVAPLHLQNYDQGKLNAAMWQTVLNFASYAGFDTANELTRINACIKDEWMKLSITPLGESRAANDSMDAFSGDHKWSDEFEACLEAVMGF
jgi:hypothetical protein